MDTYSTIDLIKFLVKAKTNTYASGQKAIKNLDGSKTFKFQEGNFMYIDNYFDFNPFLIGHETVYDDEAGIWVMNYSGNIHYPENKIDKLFENKINKFLREALQKVEEKNPFRGPTFFEKGNLVYKNEIEGDITSFKGKEHIILGYELKIIHSLEYQGCLNPIIIQRFWK